MPFINTRLKSKKTSYRPPECLNSPVAYIKETPRYKSYQGVSFGSG